MTVFCVVLKILPTLRVINTLQFFSSQDEARDFLADTFKSSSAETPMRLVSKDELHIISGLDRLFPNDAYSYTVESMSIIDALNLLKKSIDRK